jgi:predicted phosphodiesterase
MRSVRTFVVVVTILLIQSVCAGQNLAAPAAPQTASSVTLDLRIPLQPNSIRFAVIGDSGTGGREQYDLAQRMETYRQATKFDFVIMLGDNIYGSHSPQDFARKFEQPYKPLLDAGVKFYASLGNHDDPNDERLYMDPAQLTWLDQKLKGSQRPWKICFFHHPLYNDGRHHGADVDLRSQLAPLLQQNHVNVVFSGHEHVYERMKPENNIYYFVLGNSGKLMTNDFRGNGERVKSFDTDLCFMLVEMTNDKLYFQTIARNGQTIDSGELPRITEAKPSQ